MRLRDNYGSAKKQNYIYAIIIVIKATKCGCVNFKLMSNSRCEVFGGLTAIQQSRCAVSFHRFA